MATSIIAGPRAGACYSAQLGAKRLKDPANVPVELAFRAV
jgi:hypothetical protein